MKSQRLIFATLSVLAVCGTSFAAHFDFDTTDVNSSVLIRNIVLTDRFWGDGDEIAVFTPGGVCAGANDSIGGGTWVGIAAWGDDALTENVIEGFRDGEAMHFKGWDASAAQEFEIPEIDTLEGGSVWRANGLLVCDLAQAGLHYRPIPTLIIHRILCTSAAFRVEDSLSTLQTFDQIGILTPAGEEAGVLVWDAAAGQALGWAFGDNPTTDRLEGFRAGDHFSFLYYTRNEQFSPINLEFRRGDSVFTTDGVSEVALEYYFTSVNDDRHVPFEFAVTGPYPNPFNGRGSISIAMPQPGTVTWEVIDLLGRQVRPAVEERLATGVHKIDVDFSSLSGGTYFLQVHSGLKVRNARFVLVK